MLTMRALVFGGILPGLLFVLLLSAAAAPERPNPPVRWDPERVEAEVVAGTAVTVPVAAEVAVAVSDADLSPAGGLADYVATPPVPDELPSGRHEFALVLAVPPDVEVGAVVDGVVQLREGRRVRARPLPVEITVTDPDPDPDPDAVAVDAPAEVDVDEPFDLVATVTGEGQPVAEVDVALTSVPEVAGIDDTSAVTGDDGRAVFADLALPDPGDFEVTVSAGGRQETVTITAVDPDPDPVEPDAVAVDAPAEVDVDELFDLVTTVTGEGQPVAEVDVALTSVPEVAGIDDTSAVTGDDGRAVFADLALPDPGDFEVTVSAGGRQETVTITAVDPDPDGPPELEPDSIDPTVTTTVYESTAFLYTGEDPVQVGVDPDDIEPRRASVVRGRVLDRDGDPLPGARVSVLDRPEFGYTHSRADGWFDVVVNGGGTLTVEYQLDGHLPSQRRLAVPWQDYVHAPDVALVTLDDQATTVDLTADEAQLHQASTVADDDGERTAAVLVPDGVSEATMTLPDGTEQTLDEVTIRASEHTVGDTGPEAMPGDLPPQVAYTYAVELSVDEALAQGATTVEFDEPVVSYVEDFIGFGAGENVPAAFYDRDRGEWIPADDGVIIEMVDASGDLAAIDVTGDGEADDAATLAEHGIDDAERAELADHYDTGDTLWRVEVEHFSAWDYNWPFFPPSGAEFPGLLELLFGRQVGPDDDCEQRGSTIDCLNQALRTAVDVAGSDQALHYTSRRAPARQGVVAFPVTGTDIPEPLSRVDVEIEVAGQRETRFYEDPEPGLIDEFEWDGLDAYGRPLQGEQAITISVGFVYEGVYGSAAQEQAVASFGSFPSNITGNPTREEVTFWQEWRGSIGSSADRTAMGVGGWTLTDHHRYDPHGRTLQKGDGTQRSTAALPPVITTAAGTGAGSGGAEGDGGPATDAVVDWPHGVDVGPDGSLYIATRDENRVRRVDPDGIITTVAGSGQRGFSGDGGPATEAELHSPMDVTLADDGTLYIADRGNNRIRRVSPDGIITTIAGNGDFGVGGDGGPAIEAQLDRPTGLAAGTDGSIYIAHQEQHRVRRIGTDGIITTVAGTGVFGFGGDGGPAVEAQIDRPAGLAVGPDGSAYIADRGNDRIRRVSSDGIITTVAGTGNFAFGGDGGPATNADLASPTDVIVAPDGGLYIADRSNQRVRFVDAAGTIRTVAGTGEWGFAGDGGHALDGVMRSPRDLALAPDGSLYIADGGDNRIRRVAALLGVHDGSEQVLASSHGAELYVFTPAGRHQQTVHAVTGAMLRQFHYEDGLLTGVTDADGNHTEVARDSDGHPTAIIGPFGQETELAVNGEGYVSGVTDPAGQQWQLSTTEDGLLTSRTDPLGRTSEYDYDAGRLIEARDPAGAAQMLIRTELDDGFEVVHTSTEGLQTRYATERTAEGGRQQIVESPAGAVTQTTLEGGAKHTVYPDGTEVTLRETGDPRFGMQTPVTDELEITTPQGRKFEAAVERAVDLADADDLLSVTMISETAQINDRTVSRVHDVDAGLVTVTSAAGRETTVEVDDVGRPIRVDGDGLHPEELAYDSRGLLTELAQGAQRWTYAHDERGRVETVETAVGQQFAYAYDAADRLVETVLPGGTAYAFGYNGTDLPTEVDMPSGDRHQLDYTHRGRWSSYVPAGADEGLTRTFDGDGRLRERTLPSGRAVEWTYGAGDGRLMGETYPEADVGFDYADDGTDRPETVTWDPDGGAAQELGFAYDGSLVTATAFTGVAEGAFTFDYDDDFFLTGLTLEAGDDTVEAELERDADGALTGFGPFAFTRSGPFQATSTIADDTLEVAYGHDAHGRVSQRSHTVDGDDVYTLEVVYDEAGRVTSRSETIDSETVQHDYVYDVDSQLIEVRRDGEVVEAYDYDANGNRTARDVEGAAPESAEYDSQDRLVERGDVAYGFDVDGFMTHRGDDTSTYSTRGELLAADVDGQTVTYTSDALGRRTARTDAEGTTEYLFGDPGDPFQLTALRAPDGTLTFFYYDRDGLLYALDRGGDRYYVATDQVGSPRVVTDADGQLVRAITYDTYGNVTSDTAPNFVIGLGFAGGLHDPATGLVRFGLRDYDPQAGRWTARDPALYASEQANLYAYAANSPASLRDPTGLVSIGGSGYAFIGGGAEVSWEPGEGFSVCVEAGVGAGASVNVNPFGSQAQAGSRTVTSVAAGPASVGASIAVDPCGDLDMGVRAGVSLGPASAGVGTGGIDASVGGKPGDLGKNVRETFRSSDSGFGLRGRAARERCWAW